MQQLKDNVFYIEYGELGIPETSFELIRQNRFGQEPVMVQFADETVFIPRARFLIYNFFWFIYKECNYPITVKDCIFPLSGAMTKPLIARIQTHIFRQLIKFPGVTQAILKELLWQQINQLSNFISEELCEYQESISIHDFAVMHESEPVAKLRLKEGHISKGIVFLEKHLKYFEKEFMTLLSTKDAIPNNVLYNAARANILKPGQVRQMFGHIGLKTDINETVIMYFVPSSVIDGMKNIFDFVTDSFSARKAAFYTHESIRKSQYMSRRIHLLCITLRHIHEVGCGSPLLMPFKVTDLNYRSLDGTMVYDGDKFVMIDSFNKEQFRGKEILMRSPLLCKHTDGACVDCCGGMMDYISHDFNLGMVSAMSAAEPPTQQLLSTKHHDGTSSIEYKLDMTASNFFNVTNSSLVLNDLWWKNVGKLMLGIPSTSIRSLYDLLCIEASSNINERRFSSIDSIKLLTTDNREFNIRIKSGDSVPFITKQLLLYIKSRYDDLVTDDKYVWIPLDKLAGAKRFPFFKAVVLNDSIMAFVEAITSFLSTNITKYTDLPTILEDFSNLVYSKVDINILHVQMLLKAFLITDNDNYDIPAITDIHNVKFGSMQSAIANRTFGGQFGYERFKSFVISPRTYMTYKSSSPFDEMIGM